MTEKDYAVSDATTTAQLIILAVIWFHYWWFLIPAILLGLAAFAYVMKRKAHYKAKGEKVYREWRKKPLTIIRSVLAIVYDAIVLNFIVGSMIFLRHPQEWLLTTRLQEIKAHGKGWRYKQAILICGWLDKWDKGHCD